MNFKCHPAANETLDCIWICKYREIEWFGLISDREGSLNFPKDVVVDKRRAPGLLHTRWENLFVRRSRVKKNYIRNNKGKYKTNINHIVRSQIENATFDEQMKRKQQFHLETKFLELFCVTRDRRIWKFDLKKESLYPIGSKNLMI